MKKLIFLSCLWLIVGQMQAAHGQEGAQANEPVAEAQTAQASGALAGLGDFVTTTVEAQMRSLDIPAATVSVVQNGELVFAKGFGVADRDDWREVVASETLFRPGSVSKLFTWTAVMQLVEQGKVSLDADVNQYLNTFQIADTFDEPVTLAHILTHTAGFEEGALGFLIAEDASKALPLREAMAKYQPRRINAPGAYSSYSNYATALAGLVVENVSGLPFNAYIKKHIFDPLGMTQSSFDEPLPPELDADMAVGYKRKAGAWKDKPFEIISSFGPAGAMSSTSTDMAKFMLAHLNGGELNGKRILTAETAQLMHSRQFGPDERISGMAYGFYESSANGLPLIGHGGDTTLFHSNLFLDKTNDLGVFVSYMGDKGGQARSEFVQAFYDRFFPKPLETVTPPADFDERAAKYAGKYKFWRHNQSTLEKAAALMGGIQVAPSGEGTLIVSGIFPTRQYVEIGKNLFRQVDGHQRIAFGEDANGNIQDMYLDGMAFMAASRAPVAESGLLTSLLPGVAFIMFATVWTGWAYRRKEYKAMQDGERTAVRLSMATAAANLVFAISMLVILTAHQETIFFDIPGSLRAALVLPDIASLLALGTAYFAVKAWRDGYWRLGRRIHYSLVAFGGIFMAWFYYHWNFLGIQIA